MNIANIIIFISSLICLFLATLIFLKNKKKFSNICLAVFVVNLSGWGISIAMMAITIDVICPRFAFWFISAAFICFTLFIKEYLKGILKFKGVNNLLLYIFVFIGLFFWSISFTELIIADVVTNVINGVYFTGVSLILGSLYNFLVTYYILNFLFILHLMVMGYKEATSVIVKSQMKYFFFGIMLFTVCALATNLILPFFGIFNFNNLGPTFSVIMIGFISYAITRYRFMDIRLIIVRSIVFSFLVLIITAAFSAVSALVTYSFANVTGLKSNIISSVAVVVFLVACSACRQGFGISEEVFEVIGVSCQKRSGENV